MTTNYAEIKANMTKIVNYVNDFLNTQSRNGMNCSVYNDEFSHLLHLLGDINSQDPAKITVIKPELEDIFKDYAHILAV